MTRPVYTLSCSLPADRLSAELARLTGFLLQAPYAFLQTFHPAGHLDLDIFDTQPHLLLRVAFRPEDTPQGHVILSPSLPLQPAPTPATLSLVQALTRLWAPTSPSER